MAKNIEINKDVSKLDDFFVIDWCEHYITCQREDKKFHTISAVDKRTRHAILARDFKDVKATFDLNEIEDNFGFVFTAGSEDECEMFVNLQLIAQSNDK